MTDAAIWVNGERQRSEGAHLSARDRGLTLADGLFETMRASNGTVFRLSQHLTRLEHGLVTLEIPVPQGLRGAVADAVAAAGPGVFGVRLTVTRGVGPAGLAPPAVAAPTLIVAVTVLPQFPEATYREGLTARVASGRRNQHAMTAGLKTLAYTDSVAALLEARRHAADEAIFLDTDGHCSEATASNLFAWIGESLVTPPQSCGALPGITRAAVLELAIALGIRTEERAFGPEALGGADEAFLTSSLRGLAPLVRLDGGPIGSGRPGDLTRQFSDAYLALVAKETGA